MEKPVIGVVPLVDAEKQSYWMLPGYMRGLEAAGAAPVMLPLTADGAVLERLTTLCDGILLTGGQDVEPALYGREKSPACGETCPARDAMERRLLELALARDLPLLGICRGIQLLNAALGGTLVQDLPGERPSAVTHRMQPPYDRAAHTVRLLPGTPLASLLGMETLGVNSCHHQGIGALASPLREMACAPDGLIEAVYLPDRRFAWAVQWHPEFSFETDENSRRIFQAFVAAARMDG